MITVQSPKPKISRELKKACEYFNNTGRFPLEGLYLSPGMALGRSPETQLKSLTTSSFGGSLLAQDLFEGFKKINDFMGVSRAANKYAEDLPIIFRGTDTGGSFYVLSGQEQYLRFIQTSPYLLARADRHLAVHFRNVFAEKFRGAVVLELGSGNGEKTLEILAGLDDKDSPAVMIFEDLVGKLCQQAKTQICRKKRKWGSGKPVKGQNDNVVAVTGNLLYQKTWDKIQAILDKYKDHKLVVLSQGATILNNFTSEQTETLLGHLSRLKIGTEFLISADSTLSKQALRDEYFQPAFFHLVLTSFTHIMREVDKSFNPRDITGCALEIDDSDGKTAKIAPIIEWNGQPLIQQDIVKVGIDEITRNFNAHGMGVRARWRAGGEEFSKIDHAFVTGIRTDNPQNYAMQSVISIPKPC